MKQKDIAALLDEPAYAHNQKAKSGCAKPKPGATAGGCAFDGAQIALLPIADVAHIVHGSIACAGSSWDNRGTRSSGPTLYKIGMTTDLTEQDVVMGRGEKRLFHSIKQAIDSYSPAAVFVYNTCIPALIGDDVEAVCKEATARWGTPVAPVDAAGFYGTKNLGNRIAGEAMVKHVCGTREPDPVPPGIESAGETSDDAVPVNLHLGACLTPQHPLHLVYAGAREGTVLEAIHGHHPVHGMGQPILAHTVSLVECELADLVVPGGAGRQDLHDPIRRPTATPLVQLRRITHDQ